MTEAGVTVLGGAGFIGSHLIRHLREAGRPCDAPARGEDLRGRNLGHVIYCAGLTGDFRTRPYEGVDAHVSALVDFIRTCRFDSLVYLSSTRSTSATPVRGPAEEDALQVEPSVFDDFYALSKMMGEAVALSSGPQAHVVRLSNVYGDNFGQPGFLSDVLKDALTAGSITLQTSRDSNRDYVRVEDVVDLLSRIAIGGTERVYNVASGRSVTNGELLDAIVSLTGCRAAVRPGAETVKFPEFEIERIRREFGFTPGRLLDDLPRLVETCAQDLEQPCSRLTNNRGGSFQSGGLTREPALPSPGIGHRRCLARRRHPDARPRRPGDRRVPFAPGTARAPPSGVRVGQLDAGGRDPEADGLLPGHRRSASGLSAAGDVAADARALGLGDPAGDGAVRRHTLLPSLRSEDHQAGAGGPAPAGRPAVPGASSDPLRGPCGG